MLKGQNLVHITGANPLMFYYQILLIKNSFVATSIIYIYNKNTQGINKFIYWLMPWNIISFHICIENLALNKTTWQRHPWPESHRDFGSENAVDGMYTDRGINGQCTINNDGQYTAEWTVDLGNVLSISYINIYYRTDNGSTLH